VQRRCGNPRVVLADPLSRAPQLPRKLASSPRDGPVQTQHCVWLQTTPAVCLLNGARAGYR
jgi:hypothetical protein